MNEGGMKAFREQQERSMKTWQHCDIHGDNPTAWACPDCMREARALLLDLDTALADWMRTYAGDLSGNSGVESFRRIADHGGTLAYIAQLREKIRRTK